MLGGRSREWKNAYRTQFSYRRVYDELSIATAIVMVAVWLLIVQGDIAAMFVLGIVVGVASEVWGREALWLRLPPAVRRDLPKEPLDAKAVPGAIVGYRDLYRALRMEPRR